MSIDQKETNINPLTLALEKSLIHFKDCTPDEKFKLFRTAADFAFGDRHRANQFFLSPSFCGSRRVGPSTWIIPSNIRQMINDQSYSVWQLRRWQRELSGGRSFPCIVAQCG